MEDKSGVKEDCIAVKNCGSLHNECDVLECRTISGGWGKHRVLDGVSLSVEKGKLTCLTGPNGSGKSTLLRILAGLAGQELKYSGNVFINGKSFLEFKHKELARKVAWMQQNEISSWNYSVREVVLTGRFCHTSFSGIYSEKDYRITDEVIARVGIEELKDRNVFELSGGEYQKVRIARCLAQEPEYLLLDEPVANLDFSYQNQLLNLLKELAVEKKMGVLVSIHDLNTACRFADKIVLLPKHKNCFTGSVEQTMVPDLLEQTYGQRFTVYTHPVYGCLQVAAE